MSLLNIWVNLVVHLQLFVGAGPQHPSLLWDQIVVRQVDSLNLFPGNGAIEAELAQYSREKDGTFVLLDSCLPFCWEQVCDIQEDESREALVNALQHDMRDFIARRFLKKNGDRTELKHLISTLIRYANSLRGQGSALPVGDKRAFGSLVLVLAETIENEEVDSMKRTFLRTFEWHARRAEKRACAEKRGSKIFFGQPEKISPDFSRTSSQVAQRESYCRTSSTLESYCSSNDDHVGAARSEDTASSLSATNFLAYPEAAASIGPSSGARSHRSPIPSFSGERIGPLAPYLFPLSTHKFF